MGAIPSKDSLGNLVLPLRAVHLAVPLNDRLLHSQDHKIRHLIDHHPYPSPDHHPYPSHLHHLVNEAGNAPLGEEIAKFFDGHRGTSSHLSAHFQVRQVIPGILSFLITIILQNLNRFPKK